MRDKSLDEKTATPGVIRAHTTECGNRGKRCKCPYELTVTHRGTRKQEKTRHASYKAACEAKADRMGTKRQAPQSRRPFDRYAREWIASCQGRNVGGLDDDTRKSYERALELHAIPHFGSTPLRDITRRDIEKLIATLQRKGLAAGTISRYLAPVRALFSDAVDRGDVAANPALKLRINAKAGKTAKTGVKREKTLTRAELSAVLQAIPEQHRLVFELMAGTGCRISEALGLEWSDLENHGDHTTLRIERQWYRGTLKPNTKTEAGKRTIELSPELAAKLWAKGADATGPMFHTRSGRRLSDRNLRRVLDAATASVGLVAAGHHIFRHVHGSMLLVYEGWSIPEVSKRLGHADPAITAQVYAHELRDQRRDLSFLDRLGAPEGEELAA